MIAVERSVELARERRARWTPFSPVRDAIGAASRNLIAYRRVPQLLVFSTIQPVIFVLMFRYVFGGAIQLGAFQYPYVDYLMPGIFAQTVVFGSLAAGIGLATDLKSGLLERFRSLPMARSAVLAGRTIADLTRNVFVIALMVLVGFLVGFNYHTNLFLFVCALLLLLLFGYMLSWIFATVGLLVGDPETAQAAAFPILAPLVFASSAFVRVETMPWWLRVFARNQPVSQTVDAARALVDGGPTATHLIPAILWCVGIIGVFGPLAVRRYRNAV
ncbi:MAG TPA: ABC transporter permease [Actinomycetota bacterium]|nr:ABC transporter permease [Actinomycetota bacterium]